MAFSSHVWNQLKNLTKGDLTSALDRDGWTLYSTKGAIRLYLKGRDGLPPLRVEIHYHAGPDTCGPGLLKGILKSTEWTEGDFVRLGLVKGAARRDERSLEFATVRCDCVDGTVDGSLPCPRCGGTRFVEVPL